MIPDFENSQGEEQENECSICMQQFWFGQRVLRLQCNKHKTHDFHEQCIRPWLDKGETSCPYCRQTIKLRKFTQYVFWSEKDHPRPDKKSVADRTDQESKSNE
ncbi:hypothetical protein DFH28DRAFT_425436 [Melampsora americana]|nr:hypothetical protein DFH28DRAFT_425436 [Melampsora americana]